MWCLAVAIDRPLMVAIGGTRLDAQVLCTDPTADVQCPATVLGVRTQAACLRSPNFKRRWPSHGGERREALPELDTYVTPRRSPRLPQDSGGGEC